MSGLLNPPEDLEVAQKMIRLTQEKLDAVDTRLRTKVLDRELYLQVIGARQELERLLNEQWASYRQETNV